MVSKSKVHLLLHEGRPAGCGLRQPRFHTRRIEDVTCKACQKSIQMHDLLVLRDQQPNQ